MNKRMNRLNRAFVREQKGTRQDRQGACNQSYQTPNQVAPTISRPIVSRSLASSGAGSEQSAVVHRDYAIALLQQLVEVEADDQRRRTVAAGLPNAIVNVLRSLDIQSPRGLKSQ